MQDNGSFLIQELTPLEHGTEEVMLLLTNTAKDSTLTALPPSDHTEEQLMKRLDGSVVPEETSKTMEESALMFTETARATTDM